MKLWRNKYTPVTEHLLALIEQEFGRQNYYPPIVVEDDYDITWISITTKHNLVLEIIYNNHALIGEMVYRLHNQVKYIVEKRKEFDLKEIELFIGFAALLNQLPSILGYIYQSDYENYLQEKFNS